MSWAALALLMGFVGGPAWAEPGAALRAESGESQAGPVAKALTGLEEPESSKSTTGGMTRREFLGTVPKAAVATTLQRKPTFPEDEPAIQATARAMGQLSAVSETIRRASDIVERSLNDQAGEARTPTWPESEFQDLLRHNSPGGLINLWHLDEAAAAAQVLQGEAAARLPSDSAAFSQITHALQTYRAAVTRWNDLNRRYVATLPSTNSVPRVLVEERGALLNAVLEPSYSALAARAKIKTALQGAGLIEASQVVPPLTPWPAAPEAQRALVRGTIVALSQDRLALWRLSGDTKFGRTTEPLADDPTDVTRIADALTQAVMTGARADGLVGDAFAARERQLWDMLRQRLTDELLQQKIPRERIEEVWQTKGLEITGWGLDLKATPESLRRTLFPSAGADVAHTQTGAVASTSGDGALDQERPADTAELPVWSSEAMAPLKAAWARWPNRESGARLVPWMSDRAAAHPSVLTLYAPEPWWDTLRAALPAGAVEFASPEALVSGATGLLLLDASADPAALPADRPVALRLAQPTDLWRPDDPRHEALNPETLLNRLWYLASQPTLRGDVYLWVPESAQPAEWDQRSVLVLAVEA